MVIVGPATVPAIEQGLACAARGATVVQFMGTEPGATLPLPTFDFYFKELRLVPSYSCGPVETRRALDLICAGVVGARQVVTHRFPLEEAAEAYRVAAVDKSAIKTLVTFSGKRRMRRAVAAPRRRRRCCRRAPFAGAVPRSRPTGTSPAPRGRGLAPGPGGRQRRRSDRLRRPILRAHARRRTNFEQHQHAHW